MKTNHSAESDATVATNLQSLQLLCVLVTGQIDEQDVTSLLTQSGFKEIFLKQLSWHQLAPLIDQSDDRVRACLAGDIGERVNRLKFALAANVLKHLKETTTLIEHLARVGIRVLTLKGPVLSQWLYGTPVKRHARDIDLLVSAEDVPEVTRRLLAAGYNCEFAEFLQPGFYRQYTFLSKDVSFYHPLKDIVIELHWRLMSNPELMPIEFEDAWSAREEVILNDSSVAVLGSVDNALYLACHGSVAHWARLKWVADWHQLLINNTVNWQQLLTKARSMGKEIYLKNACDNASYWFGSQASETIWELTGRAPSRLIAANRYAQLQCEYPSVVRGAVNRLVMANSLPAIWQEYLRTLGTSVADIMHCRLPDQLFPLYYLLRPVIYLARKMRKPDLI